MYTVPPGEWEAMSYTVRGSLHQVFFCQFLHYRPLAKSSQGSVWGLSSESVSSLCFQKVMHLSSDLPQGQPQLWLQGCQHLASSASLFILSIFNSSIWATSNNCQCPSLASQRASSHEWSLPQVWEWGPVWWLGRGVTQHPPWSSSNLTVPPHLCRQLLREDRMSLIAFSICLGL